MKRRKTLQLDVLTGQIGNLDPTSIDRLYGLEPVYEPGRGRWPAGSATLSPEEFVAVQCPYCGERLETRVDLTSNEAGYIEDCEVCCRPIEFAIERDAGGALACVRVQRMG